MASRRREPGPNYGDSDSELEGGLMDLNISVSKNSFQSNQNNDLSHDVIPTTTQVDDFMQGTKNVTANKTASFIQPKTADKSKKNTDAVFSERGNVTAMPQRTPRVRTSRLDKTPKSEHCDPQKKQCY